MTPTWSRHNQRIYARVARILTIKESLGQANLELAAALKDWRGDRPRVEVAGLLGISPSFLNDIEYGRRPVPAKMLERLRRTFGKAA